MFQNPSRPRLRFVSYQGFIFLAGDVEAALIAKLREHDHLANNDEGALLRWVQEKVEGGQNPSPVPDEWKRFVYIANDLAQAGKGEFYCSQCGISMPTTDLTDDFEPDSIMQRLRCPNGHIALEVQMLWL